MSYIKQTWVNLPNQTTPISAERLNHMEDGIEGVDIGKENLSNKVTSISSSSTDEQYPSAKLLYDIKTAIEDEIGDIGDAIDEINGEVV